jgi:hypothetical protein
VWGSTAAAAAADKPHMQRSAGTLQAGQQLLHVVTNVEAARRLL